MPKKKPKTRSSVTRRFIATPSSFAFPLLRTFLLALVGVVASGYGVWRYYTVPRPSMRAPAAPAPPAATEIPIELE